MFAIYNYFWKKRVTCVCYFRMFRVFAKAWFASIHCLCAWWMHIVLSEWHVAFTICARSEAYLLLGASEYLVRNVVAKYTYKCLNNNVSNLRETHSHGDSGMQTTTKNNEQHVHQTEPSILWCATFKTMNYMCSD